LGAEYDLPTIGEIRETVVSLPKHDTAHSWLAFEFCTVCLLNEFRDFKKEETQVKRTHGASFLVPFDVKETLWRTWQARLVRLWFPSSSFRNYYVGLLAYANVRLSMAPMQQNIQNNANELRELISREHSLAKIARRHRAEIQRQKHLLEHHIDNDIEFVESEDPCMTWALTVKSPAAPHSDIDLKVPQSDKSSGSNTLSTRSSSLNTSGALLNGSPSVSSVLMYIVPGDSNQELLVPLVPSVSETADLKDASLMSRLTLLLQQIYDGEGNPISDSTMAEISSCLLALKSNKPGGVTAPQRKSAERNETEECC
jgi:hypothetical protein